MYGCEYLCSRRIICSRMDWSGLLLVGSMRMFVELLLAVPAVVEEGGDER